MFIIIYVILWLFILLAFVLMKEINYVGEIMDRVHIL